MKTLTLILQCIFMLVAAECPMLFATIYHEFFMPWSQNAEIGSNSDSYAPFVVISCLLTMGVLVLMIFAIEPDKQIQRSGAQ